MLEELSGHIDTHWHFVRDEVKNPDLRYHGQCFHTFDHIVEGCEELFPDFLMDVDQVIIR